MSIENNQVVESNEVIESNENDEVMKHIISLYDEFNKKENNNDKLQFILNIQNNDDIVMLRELYINQLLDFSKKLHDDISILTNTLKFRLK